MSITAGLPMRIFRAEVTAVRTLTPGMVRIEFGGEGLSEFASTGVGDEYVRVFFPSEGCAEPVLPVVDGKSWSFPEGVERSPMRTYTIRDVRRDGPDRTTVVIDFVVHEGGVAAAWALRAGVGDVVGMNTPTGLYEPPAGLRWQVLLADSTGLPAAARILEQAPAEVRTQVVFEVPSAEHEQPVSTGPLTELSWVYGGNGHGRSQLDELLRGLELPDRDGSEGAGYIWVAGESGALRAARKYLRHELGLPATAYKTIGYWTDRAEQVRARFERLDEGTKAWVRSVWSSDATPEEREDEYVRRLESLGL